MTDMLLETLNDYAEMYAAGNKNVLPAIGRIVEKLENDTGKKVDIEIVNGTPKYIIK